MLKQCKYLIDGIHISGRKFVQEFLVFAAEEKEALEKLKACLDNYEPVKEWKIRTLQNVEDISNIEGIIKQYKETGSFTYYDPIFNCVES
jgi:hypothetical protein